MHTIFAYGSNMDVNDLARWARVKKLGPIHIETSKLGLLKGFELTWHYYSEAREGGAADVTPSPTGCVYGVLMTVDHNTLAAIDRKEGHPGRYSRGPSPLDIQCPHTGQMDAAWVYRVTPSYIQDRFVPPTPAYLQIIIDAAQDWGFPRTVIQGLRETPTQAPAPDSAS